MSTWRQTRFDLCAPARQFISLNDGLARPQTRHIRRIQWAASFAHWPPMQLFKFVTLRFETGRRRRRQAAHTLMWPSSQPASQPSEPIRIRTTARERESRFVQQTWPPSCLLPHPGRLCVRVARLTGFGWGPGRGQGAQLSAQLS